MTAAAGVGSPDARPERARVHARMRARGYNAVSRFWDRRVMPVWTRAVGMPVAWVHERPGRAFVAWSAVAVLYGYGDAIVRWVA